MSEKKAVRIKLFKDNSRYKADRLTTAQESPFDNEIAHFVRCVQGKEQPRTPIEQACDLQRMLQGIYDSGRLGREVTL